jgi:hypothetical protein
MFHRLPQLHAPTRQLLLLLLLQVDIGRLQLHAPGACGTHTPTAAAAAAAGGHRPAAAAACNHTPTAAAAAPAAVVCAQVDIGKLLQLHAPTRQLLLLLLLLWCLRRWT